MSNWQQEEGKLEEALEVYNNQQTKKEVPNDGGTFISAAHNSIYVEVLKQYRSIIEMCIQNGWKLGTQGSDIYYQIFQGSIEGVTQAAREVVGKFFQEGK
jgi:hypothetical protein